MEPISVAAVALGTSVVKSACRLWCGNDTVASDAAETVADMLKDRLADAIEQRKLTRMFDTFADIVAQKVLELNLHRFKDLPANEREAAILAVAESFDRASMSDQMLYRFDLDALYLERHLRAASRDGARRWALSENATAFYDLVLRESCTYVLEIHTTLPNFVPGAFAELLRRMTVIEDRVARVLERIPARHTAEIAGDEGFAADYRRQVVRQLDRMELYGAPVSDASRGYPLSVAYISLNVSTSNAAVAKPPGPAPPLTGSELGVTISSRKSQFRTVARTDGVPVTAMMVDARRLFVRGEAGCGKTTLLQWLAVNAAHQSFPSELDAWNGLVPFFIPLRRYAQEPDFPRPEQFLEAVGQLISAQMPTGWVQRLLGEGRALVLVDGVDELPEARRPAAQAWLRDLVAGFPEARYVVTSRPAAVASPWLARAEFSACMIQPMAPSDIRQFIVHWHNAIRSMTPEQRDRDELAVQERNLQHTVAVRRDLRQLATNPLLCALLCALNRDRRTRLPHGRTELYRVALEMLLQRRDAERHVLADGVPLSLADKQELLQDLAYWFMKNELTDAERARALDRLEERLRIRHTVTATAAEVLATLLERSGVVREPEVGRIDFIHRTFQEFLAAQAVVANDDIELLIGHAPQDQWRQVFVIAVGLGSPKQRNALISALLDPPRRLRSHQPVLDVVALACMETADDLTPAQKHEIARRAAHLLPPSAPEHVSALAPARDLVLEMIDPERITSRARARYTAQLAALVGGAGGLAVIEQLAQRKDLMSVSTLISLWEYFDPDEYAGRVLSGRVIQGLEISSPMMVGALSSLPSLQELDCRFGEPWADYSFLARLPNLHTVRIILPFGGTPVTIDAPADLQRIVFTSRAGHQEAGRVFDGSIETALYQQGQKVRALAIVGLDSARVLTQLKTSFQARHVVVSGDDQLRDLRSLRLPETTAALTVDDCRNLGSVAGLENLSLPELRALSVERAHNPWIEMAPLFAERAETVPPTLVDQLDFVHVDGIPIADIVHRLGAAGFDLKTNQGRAATWTRPHPEP